MSFERGTFAREPAHWAARLPRCVRRVLMLGWNSALADVLRQSGVELWVVTLEAAGHARAVRAGHTAHLANETGEPLPFLPEHLDCIVLPGVNEHHEPVGARIRWLLPYLPQDGLVLFAVRNANFAAHPGSHSPQAGTTFRGVQETLQAEGLNAYYIWSDPEAETFANKINTSAESGVDGVEIDWSDPSNRHRWSPAFLVMAVRREYNPVRHAQALFAAGRPGWAHEILEAIPERFLQHSDMKIAVGSERQLCLLAWMKAVSGRERLELFYMSQALFYQIMATLPTHEQALRLHAEAWHVLGDDAMAAGLLRSVLHVSCDHTAHEQLARYAPEPVMPVPCEAPPVWTPSSPAPRILFVTHPRPHYGLDVLYDGLCEVLGAESVVEYPWKPTLHGQTSPELARYPCLFNRPGADLPFSDILAQLAKGEFSFIVWGDLERGLDAEEARALVQSAGETPLFVLDQQDDPLDNLTKSPELLGIAPERAAGYFKREMLACYRYPERTFPLPFAYADAKVPQPVCTERPNALFWAGHRQFGLRRLYLEHIEQAFGMRLDHKYSQSEYTQALASSRIGINIFGGGFDTVRYWEIPAHGCMLLSERLPIRIPHNFRDGESAVFFDDLEDLDAKLKYYLAHPEEAAEIARAGHAHLIRHHTASARARHMLGWVEELAHGQTT